jgi:hypothetical protein
LVQTGTGKEENSFKILGPNNTNLHQTRPNKAKTPDGGLHGLNGAGFMVFSIIMEHVEAVVKNGDGKRWERKGKDKSDLSMKFPEKTRSIGSELCILYLSLTI